MPDNDKTENQFYLLLGHFLKSSLSDEQRNFAPRDDPRLDTAVVSVGCVPHYCFTTDPVTLTSSLHSSNTKFDCLFIPQLQVARRLLLLSVGPFDDLADLAGPTLIEYIQDGRIGYYTMELDIMLCVRRRYQVVRKLVADDELGAIVAPLSDYNVLPCQLLFRERSPLEALQKIPAVQRVIYIDRIQANRDSMARYFEGCPKMNFKSFTSVSQAISHTISPCVILLRHTDDKERVISGAVETVRATKRLVSVIVAYMDEQPHYVAHADAVFKTSAALDVVASHVLHSLVLLYNREQLRSQQIRSF